MSKKLKEAVQENVDIEQATTSDVEQESDAPKGGLRFAEQIEALEKSLAETQEKAELNWDKALRAVAELENTKRRAEKDVENAHKFALDKFAKALLPVVDSLEKALEINSDSADVKAMREGVDMTHKMFVDTVEKFGLSLPHPLGEVFDPEHHEAMAMIDHPDAEPNTVVDVFQRGCLLNGRLVRPARVVVAK